jgi:fermentation-respiration switch protein FrsA (DUF1100 family)
MRLPTLEETIMRQDVSFESKGLKCAGWLYLPDNYKQGDRRPAIVMAHGFSAVKEMYLDRFAEAFSGAGFATLVFDYRWQGASAGEPRGQIFPAEQHEDYRNAITWMSLRPEVDANRIGVWGSSYSGAHVLHLAAFDRRIKCAVAQVPLVNGWDNAQRLMRPDVMAGFVEALAQDRVSRYQGGPVNYVPVVAPEGEPSVLPTPDSYKWFIETGKSRAPNWENRVTMESIEQFLRYNPAADIHRIAPTPLRMVVASNDVLTPTDLAIAAYERALEPKSLVILKGGHFDAYLDPGFKESAAAAVDCFKQHLL